MAVRNASSAGTCSPDCVSALSCPNAMNSRIEGAMFGASDVGKRWIEHSKRRINLPALRLEVRQERMEQRRYEGKALPSEVVEALAHLAMPCPRSPTALEPTR